MKKPLIISFSSFLIIVALVYTLAFTGFGNNLLKPIIEAKINENSPVAVKLNEFILRTDSFRVLLKLDDQNTALAKGSYSLFSQEFNMDYNISLNKLSKFSKFASRNLSGEFLTDGKVTGKPNSFKIKGKSDLAKGDTSYVVVMKNMQLNKANVKMSDVNIATLLYMLGEKSYTGGKLDINVQIHDLKPENMKGNINLDIKKAKLNAKLLKKEFGIIISKTDLSSKLKAVIKEDSLNYDFKLNCELAKLLSKGNIKLNKKFINTSYKIDIKELALFRNLTKSPIRGSVSTNGYIKGDKKNLFIKGNTDLASSNSSYELKLQELNPSKIILHIKDASLKRALYMAGQPVFANANINADIKLNDLRGKNLDGTAFVELSNGKINQKLMKKEFDIELPKTSFGLRADARLKPENIKYKLLFSSNLAKISSKGKVNPQNIKTDISYNVDIKEMALLKPITGSSLRGAFATSGTVKGDKKELIVNGYSNLAASKSTYALSMQDLKPKTANIDIKNAQLNKLLYLLGEPSYARANVNLNVNMSSLTPLNGKIKLKVSKGITHTKVIKKAFDINLPYTSFAINSNIKIKDDLLMAKSDINSNLAKIDIKNTQFNIKTADLRTDYKVLIPSLKRLEPILEKRLFGKVTASGEIKKNKKLTITANSKIFNGEINAKIVDENINADFTNLHTVKVLKTLGYPQVMDAPINGSFVYNTNTKKGRLDSSFESAKLIRTRTTDLISQLTRTNLTKERFNKGTLVSKINKDIINSELKMQSRNVTLNSKKFIINSKKQLIDSRFYIKVKKYSGDIIVTESIKSPKVEVDFGSILENPQTKEKIGKELNRFLERLF